MQVKAFSCLRPAPEYIGEVLGVGFGDITAGLKSKVLTLDISRALYLVALSDGERTYTSLVACIEQEGSATSSAVAKATLAGYQTEPIRLYYPHNMALDIILSAATAAVPLYNVHNGSSQLVVWRLSRPEAVEAITATFATIDAPLPELPYARTMVELTDNQAMPTLPAGLFAHKLCLS